jgi:hypothetical protein
VLVRRSCLRVLKIVEDELKDDIKCVTKSVRCVGNGHESIVDSDVVRCSVHFRSHHESDEPRVLLSSRYQKWSEELGTVE